MSDTDTIEKPPEAAPAKRKAGRPRKLKPTPQASVFSGMERPGQACADGCRPTRCVVTHNATCGSPLRGGLRADQMGDANAIRRYAEAKAYLAHAAIDKRKP